MPEAGKMREAGRRRVVVAVGNGNGGLMVRGAWAVMMMRRAQQQQHLVQLVETLNSGEGRGRRWRRMTRTPRGMSRFGTSVD